MWRMEDQGGSEIAQFRRGVIEYCVLALLRDGPKYAVEIVRQLGQADGLVQSEGTVYPLLARLRRTGHVTSYTQESPTGPTRRYYRITAQGAQSLHDFTLRWKRFTVAVDTVLEGAQ